MFATAAFIAVPLTRDRELRTEETLIATGVARLPFLFGRLTGGALFAVLCASASVLGTLAGTFMPWLDQTRIAPLDPRPYWFSIWGVVLPNQLSIGLCVAAV